MSDYCASTKYARSVLAAGPCGYKVAGASLNRALSFESAFKVQRACFIAGLVSVPSPLVRTKLGVPDMKLVNNTYHAFIKSYPTELEAMRVAAKQIRVKMTFMIDTYDLKSGLKNAITVAKEMQARGQDLPNICIDSGDYLQECRYVRRELDKAGLKDVGDAIIAANDQKWQANL